MVLLNHFVPFLIKSHFFFGCRWFWNNASRNPEIQKSTPGGGSLALGGHAIYGRAGGAHWGSIASSLGGHGESGRSAIAAGLPLEVPWQSFSRLFMEGFHCFHLTFYGTFWWFFRMFSLGTQEKPEISVFFFSGFVSWWSSFLGRKQRRWGNWPNGILTSNLANKEGNPPILTDWWYTKKVQKWVVAPNPPPFFFGYFGPFGGSHPKNPAILGIVTSLQAGWSWFYRCVHSGEREILSNSCGPFLFEAWANGSGMGNGKEVQQTHHTWIMIIYRLNYIWLYR